MATENVRKFAERLRYFRKSRKLSQSQMGGMLGISGDFLSQIELGKRQPGSSVQILFELIEQSPLHSGPVPTKYEMTAPKKASTREITQVHAPPARRGKPEPEWPIKPVKMIPLLSWAQAGIANAYEEIPADWQTMIPMPAGITDRTPFAIQLRGDSMEPTYSEGDVVIVMPNVAPRMAGDLVIANIIDEGFTFKKLTAVNGDPDRLLLEPINTAAYKAIEYSRDRFHWIYPVHSVNKVVRRS